MGYGIFFATLNNTVTNLPRYGRSVVYYLLFVYFFLSHFFVGLLSLSPQSSLLFHTHADNHFHADVDVNLSLAMVFLFFFCCGLMGSVPMEVGGFRWARLWVDDVGVGLLCGLAMTMAAMKIVSLEFGL